MGRGQRAKSKMINKMRKEVCEKWQLNEEQKQMSVWSVGVCFCKKVGTVMDTVSYL